MDIFRRIQEKKDLENKIKHPFVKKICEKDILNEMEVLPLLRNYFNDDIKIISGMSIMDFKSDNAVYELKCRTNEKDKYPTTLIGYNKIEEGIRTCKKAYFIFKYTDGLFYIEYDANVFSKFEIKLNYKEYHQGKPKKYIYIPVSILKQIY